MIRLRVVVYMLCLLCVMMVSPSIQSQSCDPLSRLVAGQQGRVLFTDGGALNVRAGAGREFAVVGALPEGTVFDVIGEAVCDGDIVWFEVQAGDVRGWSAEATITDGYFVEPLHPQAESARAILNAAPTFDMTQSAPDTIVAVRTNAGLTFTNATADTVATTPDAPFTVFSGGVSVATSAGLSLYAFDSAARTLSAPQSPDAMGYINATPSSDGTQIAWLYTDCDGPLGCSSEDVGFNLLVTDMDGANIRTIYSGQPTGDVGLFRVHRWNGADNAVILERTGHTTYPLPGTLPGSDPGYPPTPRLMEITLNGQVLLSPAAYYLYAISPDGQWRTWPEITAGRITVLNVGNQNGTIYPYPLENTQEAQQVTFAPDSSRMVWTTSIYPDAHQSHAVQIDLMTMDVTTGEVSTVWQFYEGKPFVIGWLSDTLVLVDVRTLTPLLDDSSCAGCLTIQERTLHTVVIDVVTGDIWRFEGNQPVVWVGQP